MTTGGGDGAIDVGSPGVWEVGLGRLPASWDFEADVVVIGAGATGLPAAIAAIDAGVSVLVVEANYDIGGHAILSGGNVPLGGGTSAQRKYGIEDSPDLVFADLTDWSIVQPLASPSGRAGAGLVRPLEASARAKGVKFFLNHKMTGLIRTASSSANPGRVVGITAQYTPRTLPGATRPLQSYHSAGNMDSTKPSVAIRAAKAVILATGGSTSNVNFRRMFDPRLTEVYQTAGEPYTFQDASGELAAMAIGASLWGLGNQILENGDGIRTQRALGARYNYFTWDVNSPIFPLSNSNFDFSRGSRLSIDTDFAKVEISQAPRRPR